MYDLLHILRKSFTDVAEKQTSIGANFALAAWESKTTFCTDKWMVQPTLEMSQWIEKLSADGGTDMRFEAYSGTCLFPMI